MWPELLSTILLMVVRIGMPFVIVMGLSYLAYHWLGEGNEADRSAPQPPQRVTQQPTVDGPAAVARVLYAGTHCWDVKQCPAELKATCPAYAKPELPCWLAIQMKTGHLRDQCFECNFYERPVLAA